MRDEVAVLKTIDGEAMALCGVTARGRADGLLFELEVEQRYRNPSTKNVEAVYAFPLPSSAVLLGFEVRLGEKKLAGVVVEKREAEAKYEKALDQGDAAFMLERAGEGLCTVNLGNLLAGEEATIRYRYAQLLRFEQGSVRLTVPTVIAPRYGDPAAGGLAPHQATTHDLGVAYPFALSLELRGELAKGRLVSPTHAIATTRAVDRVEVALPRGAFLDRDFVLTVDGLPVRSLSVVARDGEGCVALASFYADVPHDAAEAPLTLKLLVDCSGSMAGDSIRAAKRALHRVLEGFSPADRFTYTRFGSSVHHDVARLTNAAGNAIRNAAGCLARTDANLGGTEMESALAEVFALGGDDAADVMLITDGEIWGADTLIAAAVAAHQRVFVVGVGAAPAEGVLRRLAEATGGASEFVAPNEDAEAGILRTFGRLRAPRVERAEIAWPATPKWTVPLPKGLFGGETIHALAGFDALPAGEASLRLVRAGESAALTANAALPATAAQDRTLARVAAATRLPTANADQALALALQYELLTDRTNFVVVHERAEGEKATELPELAKVAQMHAAGWHGMGSVRVALSQDLQASGGARAHSSCEPVLASLRRSVAVNGDPTFESLKFDALEDAAPDTRAIGRFLATLDRAVARDGSATLPTTLGELALRGAPDEALRALRAMVAAGDNETLVVRAFLAAFEDRARALGLSRQLQRALRNALPKAGAQPGLRERIEKIVAALA